MKVIVPKPVTLLASNVPEDDAPVWDADTTYAPLAQVIAGHRLYSALRETKDEVPASHTTGSDPAWSDKGSTNRYRVVDVYASRQTTLNGPMLYEVDASKCDAVALFNVIGGSLALTLLAGGDVVWALPAQSLLVPSGCSYFSWFFGPREYRGNLMLRIPLHVSATLRIEIGGDSTACGEIIPGQLRYLGETVDQPEDENLDHSVVEPDQWGGYDLIPGNQTSRWRYSVQVDRNKAASVKRILNGLAARPTAWMHHNDRGYNLEDQMSFGFRSSVRRTFENAVLTTFELEITELP